MTKKSYYRIRLFMTVGLLMAYSALIAALTAISMNMPTPALVIITWLISSPFFALVVSMLWRYKLVPIEDDNESANETQEKRKRERIDAVLRDLSNEDLERLKQRLIDGSIDDELLHDKFVSDNSEEYFRKDTI